MKQSLAQIISITGREGSLVLAKSHTGIVAKANNESLARRLLIKKMGASRRALYGR